MLFVAHTESSDELLMVLTTHKFFRSDLDNFMDCSPRTVQRRLRRRKGKRFEVLLNGCCLALSLCPKMGGGVEIAVVGEPLWSFLEAKLLHGVIIWELSWGRL